MTYLNNEMLEAYKQVLGGEAPTAGEFMKNDGPIQIDPVASAVKTATKKLEYDLERVKNELTNATAEIRVLYKIVDKILNRDY